MVGVFDTSVIFPLFVQEEQTDAAIEIFKNTQDRIFPDFLKIEFSNAILSSVRRGRLSEDTALEAIVKFDELIKNFTPTLPYIDDAFKLAMQLKHPIYDCLYAIVARENSAILLTADAKFAARLNGTGIQVKLI